MVIFLTMNLFTLLPVKNFMDCISSIVAPSQACSSVQSVGDKTIKVVKKLGFGVGIAKPGA